MKLINFAKTFINNILILFVFIIAYSAIFIALIMSLVLEICKFFIIFLKKD